MVTPPCGDDVMIGMGDCVRLGGGRRDRDT